MLKRILVALGDTDYTVPSRRVAMAHDAEVTSVSIIDEGRLALHVICNADRPLFLVQ